VADIYIKLDQLNEVKTSLTSIVEEFENATERSEELEAAIGQPFMRYELRSKARDFEERWDNKRDDLKESLQSVLEHVDGVITNVEEWDTETAIGLEPEPQPAAPGTQPV
jgi:chromosome segregation ATPase